MKKILVPTDFSACALNALNYAVSLAKKAKSDLILLHAFDITYISPDVPIDFITAQINATEQDAALQLEQLQKNIILPAHLNCEIVNVQGAAIDHILNMADKNKVDLVVMGTKGASGIKELFIGSNTSQIVAKALCPVLVIPEKASFKELTTIVYATNYYSEDFSALNQLAELAQHFNASINIIHIADGEYSIKSEDEFIKIFEKKVEQKISYGKINYQLLYNEDIEKQLEKYLETEPVDLIATSTKYRNLIEGIFSKSITKKLTYHSNVPLMAFHYEKENAALYLNT